MKESFQENVYFYSPPFYGFWTTAYWSKICPESSEIS